MKLSILASAAVLALSAGGASAATNLLVDGDFESFASIIASSSTSAQNYAKVGPGSLGAWTVGGTSIDLIQNQYGSISGVSVDLAGTPGPGSLSQGFMAKEGYTYTLSFDHFVNGGGDDMVVTLGGRAPETYTAPSSMTSSSLVWTASSSGMQSVIFSSATTSNAGPTLDNVVLTAVPEPGTYAMLLAGLAAVGFVAKRRKA